jgi:hypothetical protein
LNWSFSLVCRNILSEYSSVGNSKNNFLHSVPTQIDEKYNINGLLNKCAKWELQNEINDSKNRFELVEYLLEIFNQILVNSIIVT